jgi:hypothetical protein
MEKLIDLGITITSNITTLVITPHEGTKIEGTEMIDETSWIGTAMMTDMQMMITGTTIRTK